MKCFINLRNNECVEVKELKEVKYSYPHSVKVISLEENNFSNLKISDDVNYVFVGTSTVVVRGNDILYLQFM
ncbi:hypothetical protein BUZ46_01645 [Staphylococcus hominis]|uniref:hypothetical protein n=1 Tax=Staphylococcus hominis TaxID=1290 RepID=UPI000D1E46E3|nr:hypothetical protein [Staphylococcus hominis]PTK39545.1 hypothetical protein BUZ46_01645 [Staphylococcus hominis]